MPITKAIIFIPLNNYLKLKKSDTLLGGNGPNLKQIFLCKGRWHQLLQKLPFNYQRTDGWIHQFPSWEERTLYWKILLLLNFPIADSFFLSFNKTIIRKWMKTWKMELLYYPREKVPLNNFAPLYRKVEYSHPTFVLANSSPFSFPGHNNLAVHKLSCDQ